MSARVPCPVDGCANGRNPQHVMCPQHWYRVPEGVRNTVWRLWREEPGSAAYLEARQDAIDAAGRPA